MSRPIILNIRFHIGTYNSYSSKDFEFYELIKHPDFKELRGFIKNINEIDVCIEGNNNKIHFTYYSSDNELFIIHGYVENCSKTLISMRKDLYYESQAYARELYHDFFTRKEKRDSDIDKAKGYVNYNHSYIYAKPLNDIIGHLPKKIIIDNLDYLGSGHPCGYFGSGNRMLWMDDIISKVYNEYNGNTEIQNKISMYLNYTDARHWMDNVDSMTAIDFEKSFRITIINFNLY
jgi:hypothetical protein